MRVHDVGAQRAREAREQQRVDVARRADAHRRHAQRVVEVGARPTPGSSRPTKHRLDAALGERRQQRQQVALRAADAADAVDVHDPHRARTRCRCIALDRRGGEEREQEVPGDAIARRADEGERRGRLVARAAAARARRTRAARRRARRPRARTAPTCTPARPRGGRCRAACPRRAGRSSRRRVGCQSSLRRERRELRLVARMVLASTRREVLVEAHLEALVGIERASRSRSPCTSRTPPRASAGPAPAAAADAGRCRRSTGPTRAAP